MSVRLSVNRLWRIFNWVVDHYTVPLAAFGIGVAIGDRLALACLTYLVGEQTSVEILASAWAVAVARGVVGGLFVLAAWRLR